ncbi:MAG TPA: AAA family ATPase [Syntrophales bacterium]
MYYEYWGLQKPPFDNVPDPTMYSDSHSSMENAIAETLFAIDEGNECIAVIVGDVGLGKTLSLRIIIDSLNQEKYKIALVTNPDTSFIELLKEIIGQLAGRKCEERRRIDLLEKFNKILFDTIDSGKKVLIFIDEANAISPTNLESLRLLTNMQDDQRNLFTIVLAGQLELARRLEHPKRTNLLQRIGTLSRIDKIETEDLLRGYVETRLRIAGGSRQIFADDAYNFLWEYSEHGVPRLINKMCKLSLKAGETNEFMLISGEVIRQIGERFRHLTGPAIPKRKPRKRPKSEVIADAEKEAVGVSDDPGVLSVEAFKDRRRSKHVEGSQEKEFIAEKAESAEVPAASPEARVLKKDISAEVEVGGLKFAVNIPHHIVKQAQSSTHEHRMKIAGTLAAQIMKKHEDLMSTPSIDPISTWTDLREFVASRLK